MPSISKAEAIRRGWLPPETPSTPEKPPEKRGFPKNPQISGEEGAWCTFTIPGDPIGKPRMTRADKWKKRNCVLRYRAWCDRARAAAPAHLPQRPSILIMTAYLPLPDSWSQKKKDAHRGQPHRSKPDWDNIAKSAGDALWGEDSTIYKGSCSKAWDDGAGPRVEISVR